MEIIVDSFAGGGGASTGIEIALGRSPDIAINHDATALAMHEVNHPATKHLTSDIWSVDPREVVGSAPVGLLWASPDCKHFSKAKGGKPVSKNIRSLAWVVVHWANTVRPRVIMLENVEEFQDWGPLGEDDKPCPLRKGQTFKRWVGQLKRLGYAVEWRELRACDYGAPTIRKRLFLIARRDGRPIVWPEPSHGDPKSEAVKTGRLKPWRTAAGIIDWSLPCPSIFDSAEEIFAKYGLRAVRPLQPATMARIAKGVKRYVLDAVRPFIIRTDMASWSPRNGVHGGDEPIRIGDDGKNGRKLFACGNFRDDSAPFFMHGC
jgi:DNA (cytosine-5)-methyltransferase 1